MLSMHYLADLGRLFPLECSLTLYKVFICCNRTQYEEPPLDTSAEDARKTHKPQILGKLP